MNDTLSRAPAVTFRANSPFELVTMPFVVPSTSTFAPTIGSPASVSTRPFS